MLLDRAGEPPPYLLVGHSFGGLVMRIFAQRYRRLTSPALVLVDPAHPEDWVTPAAEGAGAASIAACNSAARARSRRGSGSRAWCRSWWASARSAPARRLVDAISRGGVGADVEWLLAPLWKLPPAARRPLRSFWTRSKFYEALGSQIATISDERPPRRSRRRATATAICRS